VSTKGGGRRAHRYIELRARGGTNKKISEKQWISVSAALLSDDVTCISTFVYFNKLNFFLSIQKIQEKSIKAI